MVPESNVNLEPDLALLLPAGCSLHAARAGGYDLDAVPDADQMRRFATASVDAATDQLSAARPDVALYGCTSATLAHGPAFDREFARRLGARVRAPTVTAAGALVEALGDLGARRVAFASPYVAALNDDAVRFLELQGRQAGRWREPILSAPRQEPALRRPRTVR